jgi:hypothetical protein
VVWCRTTSISILEFSLPSIQPDLLQLSPRDPSSLVTASGGSRSSSCSRSCSRGVFNQRRRPLQASTLHYSRTSHVMRNHVRGVGCIIAVHGSTIFMRELLDDQHGPQPRLHSYLLISTVRRSRFRVCKWEQMTLEQHSSHESESEDLTSRGRPRWVPSLG